MSSNALSLGDPDAINFFDFQNGTTLNMAVHNAYHKAAVFCDGCIVPEDQKFQFWFNGTPGVFTLADSEQDILENWNTCRTEYQNGLY